MKPLHRSLPSTALLVTSLAFAAGLFASCNVFEARSDDLTCSGPADCSADRICESGYCVLRPELLPDARPTIDGDMAIDASIDANTLPTPDAGPCNSIPIFDNFEDGVAAPNWVADPANGLVIAEANGVLTFTADAVPAITVIGGYNSVFTTYQLAGSEFFLEFPMMPNLASNAEVKLLMGATSANKLEFSQKSGTVNIKLTVNSSPTTLASFGYSATQHRWWRIVDSGGNFKVQTSADGTSWDDQATAATPAFFSSVNVSLSMRIFNTGGIPGSAVIDNVNGGVDCTQ